MRYSDDVLTEGRWPQRRCFFRPDGTGFGYYFRLVWDIVQVFLLVYVGITIPLRMGFDRGEWSDPKTGWFWFEIIVDLYFWVDIFMNFRTAFRIIPQDPQSPLVIDIREIRKRYLKSWFAVDAISCMPISYIELIAGADNADANGGPNNNIKIFKTLRLLRMAKLLRLALINRLLDRLQENPGQHCHSTLSFTVIH